MLIKDANSYDLFHTEAEDIYRITTSPNRKDGSSETILHAANNVNPKIKFTLELLGAEGKLPFLDTSIFI